MATVALEKFEVRNRWTNAVQFTAEIECRPDASFAVKLGLAVKWAIKSDANLSDADLSDADLSDEQLRPFKADLFLTLDSLHAGVLDATHLIAKLRAGEVNGSSYGSPGTLCACLVGTIAQTRGVRGETLDHNSDRPAERWFLMINEGDRPGDETGGGFAAAKALEWVLDWCSCHGVDPDAPVAVASAA